MLQSFFYKSVIFEINLNIRLEFFIMFVGVMRKKYQWKLNTSLWIELSMISKVYNIRTSDVIEFGCQMCFITTISRKSTNENVIINSITILLNLCNFTITALITLLSFLYKSSNRGIKLSFSVKDISTRYIWYVNDWPI